QRLGERGLVLVGEPGADVAAARGPAVDDVPGVGDGGLRVLPAALAGDGAVAVALAGAAVDALAVFGPVAHRAADRVFRRRAHRRVIRPGQPVAVGGADDELVIVAKPVGAAAAGDAHPA